ncbi:MAG: hypothetical protein ACXWQQ_00160 [Pseudobdellovibrio sp.]
MAHVKDFDAVGVLITLEIGPGNASSKPMFIIRIVTLILFISSVAFSQEETDSETTPEPVAAEAIKPITAVFQAGARQNFIDTVLELSGQNEVNIFETSDIQGLSPEFNRAFEAKRRLNHCSQFIQPNGDYGDLGELIVNSLDRVPELKKTLMSDGAATKAGMHLVCPRFAELKTEERKEFWVWTLATLALFESTCGFDTKGDNTHAVGMFQLNASTADRLPRSMIGNKICGRYNAADISQSNNNLICTLDFIRDSFSGRISGSPAGLITDAEQFQHLRNSNNPMIKVLQKLKICQINTKMID